MKEQTLHAVFDNNAGGVVVIDTNGIIRSCNFMIDHIFGYAEKELYNQPANVLFPPDSRSDIWGGIVTKYATMTNTCMFEGSAIRKDGSLFSVEIVVAKIEETRYGKFYVCTIRDNSRKELSEKIDQLINAVLRRVLRGEEIEEFSNYICDKVMHMFDFSLVWIGLKNNDGTIKVVSASGINRDLVVKQSNVMRWDNADNSPIPAAQVIKSMETLVLNVNQNEANNTFSQIITVPLLFQNKVLGIIELHLDRGKLDETILNRLGTLALRLTMAIQIAKDQRYMRLLGTALQSSANAVLIANPSGIIEWVNKAFTKITGYNEDEIIGKSFSILRSGFHSGGFYKNMWEEAQHNDGWSGEVVKRHKLGALYHAKQTITPIKNNTDEIIYYVIAQEDLTAKKVAENRILKLSNYDQLTGLLNRKSFTKMIEKTIAKYKAKNDKFAIISITLSNFSRISETLGYNDTDKIIKMIAERIENTIDKDDTVARMSLNEFAIISKNIKTPDTAAQTARYLINKIFEEIDIDGDQINMSSCLGITIFPDDTDDVMKLLSYADVAMHKALKTAANSYFFFSPEINSETEDRIALERDIKKAVAKNEFILYYQPQIDIRTKSIVGFEVLIRWQHPERGMVSPAKFIPIAEETGVIIQIGNWVFEQAMKQWKQWHDMGLYIDTLAINVSAIQFQQEDLVENIERLINETGMQPDCLEIELTESTVMQDAKTTNNILHQLSDMGIAIAIDDFGTGYSSLSYLKKFPIDRLKIDQSFIKELSSNFEDNEIVRAIIILGHGLNMFIVSEGVENEAQLNILRGYGCDIVQGYLTGKPMPAEEAAEFFRQNIKNNQ